MNLKNHSYTQASKSNIEDIIKIHNITNNKRLKDKPKLNITTKGPSRKQIIILISANNSKTIILQANIYILNINILLKGMTSKVSANFICSNNKEVIITTNKAKASSDLNIVERYVKELNDINSNNVMNL